MREKQGKEVEDVDVTGLVLEVCMERRPRVGRRVGWEFDGVEYVWTGTRVMARSWFKGVRGYSHDLKVSDISCLFGRSWLCSFAIDENMSFSCSKPER